MLHPDFKDTYVGRYCSPMTLMNYNKDAEPTRRKKENGELENCVSFVFVPQVPSRGQVCMADDYCSMSMNFICELSQYRTNHLDQHNLSFSYSQLKQQSQAFIQHVRSSQLARHE